MFWALSMLNIYESRFDVATNELCIFCCSLADKYELDLKDPKTQCHWTIPCCQWLQVKHEGAWRLCYLVWFYLSPPLYMTLHALNILNTARVICHHVFLLTLTTRNSMSLQVWYFIFDHFPVFPCGESFKWVKGLNCSKESCVNSPVSDLSPEIAHGTLRAPDRLTVKWQTFPLGTRVVPPFGSSTRIILHVARLC